MDSFQGAARSTHSPSRQLQPTTAAAATSTNASAILSLSNAIQRLYPGLDIPEIAVVGGQSEGKSTMIQNIVSAKIGKALKFLPTGGDMVTKMPIVIQLINEPTDTSKAAISCGDGKAVEIEGPAGPAATQESLDKFGNAIRTAISAQQSAALKGQPGHSISQARLIVQISGPAMPNLSVVDLPGLIEYDPQGSPGLKDQIRDLVTSVLTKKTVTILAVAPAEADPSTWKAWGLAKQVDPDGVRTITAVSKANLIVDQDDRCKMVCDAVQNADGKMFIAGYDDPNYVPRNKHGRKNPDPKTAKHIIETRLLELGIPDKCFGDTTLAQALEKRLGEQLRMQIPEKMRQIHFQIKKQEAQLGRELTPSKDLIWDILHSWMRAVVAGRNRSFGGKPKACENWGEVFDQYLDKKMRAVLATMKDWIEDPSARPADVLETDDILARCFDHGFNLETNMKVGGRSGSMQDDVTVHSLATELVDTNLSINPADTAQVLEEAVMPLVQEFLGTMARARFKYTGITQPLAITDFPKLWVAVEEVLNKVLDETFATMQRDFEQRNQASPLVITMETVRNHLLGATISAREQAVGVVELIQRRLHSQLDCVAAQPDPTNGLTQPDPDPAYEPTSLDMAAAGGSAYDTLKSSLIGDLSVADQQLRTQYSNVWQSYIQSREAGGLSGAPCATQRLIARQSVCRLLSDTNEIPDHQKEQLVVHICQQFRQDRPDISETVPPYTASMLEAAIRDELEVRAESYRVACNGFSELWLKRSVELCESLIHERLLDQSCMSSPITWAGLTIAVPLHKILEAAGTDSAEELLSRPCDGDEAVRRTKMETELHGLRRIVQEARRLGITSFHAKV